MAVKSSTNAQPSLFDEVAFKPVPPQKKKVVAAAIVQAVNKVKILGLDEIGSDIEKFQNYIANINKTVK